MRAEKDNMDVAAGFRRLGLEYSCCSDALRTRTWARNGKMQTLLKEQTSPYYISYTNNLLLSCEKAFFFLEIS